MVVMVVVVVAAVAVVASRLPYTAAVAIGFPHSFLLLLLTVYGCCYLHGCFAYSDYHDCQIVSMVAITITITVYYECYYYITSGVSIYHISLLLQLLLLLQVLLLLLLLLFLLLRWDYVCSVAVFLLL